jgi:hypothetical protein
MKNSTIIKTLHFFGWFTLSIGILTFVLVFIIQNINLTLYGLLIADGTLLPSIILSFLLFAVARILKIVSE